MEDQEHRLPDISDIHRFRKDVLFIGSLYELKELIDVADRCFERLQRSTSAREMVLETWLVIDYLVRDLLLAAFNLKPFNRDECDLRYDFLPASFWECVRNLQTIVKIHRNLRVPKQIHIVEMTGGFMWFFHDYDSDAFDQLIKAQQAYLEEHHPDLAGTVDSHVSSDTVSLDTRRYISEGWLEVMQRLSDASWFEKAERLNGARNLAAHRYDEEKILSKLGKSGPDALEHARQYCLDMIDELVGIVPKPQAPIDD